MPDPLPERDLLLTEGDILARRLMQQLRIPLERQERVQLYGRSLVVNFIQALPPTVEQITRRTGRPVRLYIVADERKRPELWAMNPEGERVSSLSVEDLVEQALFVRGQLHPLIATELMQALHGSEHAATRALIACLKSKPVLQATQHYLQGFTR